MTAWQQTVRLSLAKTVLLCSLSIGSMTTVLRRPTPEENASFKSRVRYVLAVTGKTPNWFEAHSSGRLGRGDVWRWAYDPVRGKNVGAAKAQAAADVLGVDYQWLTTGNSRDGRIFLDEHPSLPAALERSLELRMARAVEEYVAKSEREPASSRRPYLVPVMKKVAKAGKKRR